MGPFESLRDVVTRDTKFGPGGPARIKSQALPVFFFRNRTKGAGLMLGSGKAITMSYVFAAGLRSVLERCWLGSMPGSHRFGAVPVWAGVWLLDFSASLAVTYGNIWIRFG